MALFQTYETVGIKEDISEIISNITPTKTPFQSAIGNEKTTQTVFQWQQDSLRAVAAAPVLEGADGSDVSVTPTVMKTNTTQIFAETVKVSGTLDATSTYGRARESAYQLAKSSAQLKRDLENAFVGTAQAIANGSDSVARQMAGAQTQINTSGTSNVIYTGGTSTPMTEAMLLSALQVCYTAGADPSVVQVTPANSLILAAYAAASGRYRTLQTAGAGDKTLINVVNLYVSPFGEVKVQLNRFLKAAESAFVFDPSMWSKVTLRPWFRETLAKTGDSLKQMIIGEFSLKHKNASASALVVEAVSTGF
jgi:hypothetical protein